MADIFGIQKFSLLRCLSEFEEKGAIRIEGKTITILNSDDMKYEVRMRKPCKLLRTCLPMVLTSI